MPASLTSHPDPESRVHESDSQGRVDTFGRLFRSLVVRTPLDWPILLLVLMIPVSLWATFDIRISLPKIIGLLVGVAVFYATVAYVNGSKHLVQTLVLYLSMGSGVAAVALVGTNWLYKNPLLSDIVRLLPRWIRGLPGAAAGFHPNEVAGVLLWFVPVQMALLVWLWRRGDIGTRGGIALVLSTLLTTATLLLTQSRSGWLGCAAGLMTMASWVDKRMRIAVALLLVAVLVIVGLYGPARVGAVLFGQATSGVFGSLSWAFRLQVWRAALWGVQDFPFTGMGLGAFRRVAPVLYPLSIPLNYDIAHAHNGFLQAGVDFGLPGLVAYASIWLLAARLIISSLRRSEDWLRALVIGLGGCLVGSLVYNLTDTVALGAKPGPAWWMMLALIVSTHRLVVGCETEQPT